jgi:protein SCO1
MIERMFSSTKPVRMGFFPVFSLPGRESPTECPRRYPSPWTTGGYRRQAGQGAGRPGALLLVLVLLAFPAALPAHEAGGNQRLPVIGPAPQFTLTSQEGTPLALADLRGKVVAVTFIYTGCPDICPMLTQKMVDVQNELGAEFGAKIAFVSISLDPERDTPEVLKDYAQFWGAKPEGWSFLTGSLEAVRDVTRRYGVFFSKKEDGSVEHSQLTTLVDADGQMRVQYIGARFDPEEFRRDLMSLVDKE